MDEQNKWYELKKRNNIRTQHIINIIARFKYEPLLVILLYRSTLFGRSSVKKKSVVRCSRGVEVILRGTKFKHK